MECRQGSSRGRKTGVECKQTRKFPFFVAAKPTGQGTESVVFLVVVAGATAFILIS